MLKLLVDISMYLFEAVLFYFYCQTAFKSKFNRTINLIIIILAYSVLMGIYYIGNPYINAFSNVIFCILIIYFLYNVSIFVSLAHSVLFYIFLVASEYITIPIISIAFKNGFNDFSNNSYSYILVIVISKLTHLICCVVTLKIYKYIEDKDSLKGFSLMLCIPISNIVIFELIFIVTMELEYKPEIYYVWAISGLLMMVSSFLVFFNRNYLIRQSNKINELIIENQKKELDEQYFSIIEKKNDDMQVLAHDFKNHLATIRNLDLLEEANEYIDSIYPEIEKINQIGISKNKTLDLIISKYVSLCEIKGIDFSIDVKTANLSFIENQDLTALLTNLLDNAVEAAAQSKEKKISLVIEKQNEFLEKLTVANSCDSAPQRKAGNLISHKADKEVHGFGTKSIRKIAEKYGGIYDWQYDEKSRIFTTSILFSKE